jgi:hypothetical protein
MFPNSRTSSGSEDSHSKHTKGILTLSLLLLVDYIHNAPPSGTYLREWRQRLTKNTKVPLRRLARLRSPPTVHVQLRVRCPEPLSGIFQREQTPSKPGTLTSPTAVRSMTKIRVVLVTVRVVWMVAWCSTVPDSSRRSYCCYGRSSVRHWWSFCWSRALWYSLNGWKVIFRPFFYMSRVGLFLCAAKDFETNSPSHC